VTERLNFVQADPKAYRAMLDFQRFVNSTGVANTTLQLVALRVSYLNGCAYCVDMHTKEARAHGETEQRVYAVSVWRDTPFYTPQERAALAFAEAVTKLGSDGVPDDVYAEACAQFDEHALIGITMAIIATNGWNRLSIAFRRQAGDYQPQRSAA
jgi:AhpD family alkylhydroperoxidase